MVELGKITAHDLTMPNIFNLDKKSLALLLKFQKAQPMVFQRATASILNSQAFDMRRHILHTLDDEFEIRNQRFVNSHVRVQKAVSTQKIANQVSMAGSTEGKRFTGWIEQLTGETSKTNKVTTGAARDKNFSNQVASGFRMKPGRRFKRPGDFKSKKHKKYGQQVVAMLQATRKGDSQKPFRIEKGGGPGKLSNFKEGIYSLSAGHITRVQTFGKHWKPKKVNWMDKSLSRLDRKFNLKQAWAKELDFRMKKLGAK